MKKIITFVSAILALVTHAIPPSLPMIVGIDAIQEDALSRVTHGTREVNSPTMRSTEKNSTWVNAIGSGAEDVLDKLFNTTLTYTLGNQSEKVNGHVWLYDKDNNLLFYGQAQYTISELGKSGPEYQVWIQNVPLLDNAIAAEILAVSDDGQTANRWSLEVSDGHVMFEPWYAGSPNGILVVSFQDGSRVSYNLWNPEVETPATVSETGSWSIQGHYMLRPSEKDVVTLKVVELYQRPTALVTVKHSQILNLDVVGVVQKGGISFERPSALYFTQVDGPWVGGGKLNWDGPTQTGFPADGTYRLRFEWNEFGKPGLLYTGPIIDPGSGKGAVTAPLE